MLPMCLTLVGTDGISIIQVAAGAVPATAVMRGGMAFSPAGELYVIFV